MKHIHLFFWLILNTLPVGYIYLILLIQDVEMSIIIKDILYATPILFFAVFRLLSISGTFKKWFIFYILFPTRYLNLLEDYLIRKKLNKLRSKSYVRFRK